MKGEAYMEIVEQPASKALKFRYESEGRAHGCIPGVHSTPTDKTSPTIRIIGPWVHGRVIVSCVTIDEYRAHPYRVMSKGGGARNGVFTKPLDSTSNEVKFPYLSIQCVKRRSIEKALEERKRAGVDPFEKGFDPNLISNDDLNAVRLCFQVYLWPPGTNPKGNEIKLQPVVSDLIYAKPSIIDLMIFHLSSAVASVAGGTPLMLFCQKIAKEDIQVRFFEKRNDEVVWEALGALRSDDIYDQTVITLLTPPYHTQNVNHPVHISLQLIKPSTNDSGKPVSLQLLPAHSMVNAPTDADIKRSLKRKKRNFKSIDLSDYPNKAPCGCILVPIINPNCPIHNSLIKNLNQGTNTVNDTPEHEGQLGTPETRPKLFYYNEDISTEDVMSPFKKPRYSEDFAPSRSAPMPTPYNTVHNTTPNVSQMPSRDNSIQCEYENGPAAGPSSQRLPSPHGPQCMYESPVPRNDPSIVPDVSGVPFDNLIDWQVQGEPTLQPIIVNLNEQQQQASNNYDYNSEGQIDMNQNLLDLDIDGTLNQLSDSVINGLKLSDEIDFDELDKYEREIHNSIATTAHETCEKNDIPVQGISNASQNLKSQNCLPDTWTWDS